VGTATALILTLSAHIGSPDTWFAGTAGPYPVTVLVRAPGVIPGLADVIIKVTGDGVRAVTASPAAYNAGERGVPPADTARSMSGRPGTWTTQLWIMAPGSYSVRVTVDGSRGSGTAIVPVSAVATRVLSMDRRFGWVLAGLATILLLGAVSIIGAAARESVLSPGETPDRRMRIRGRIAMAVGAIVLVAALAGGKAWWNAVDRYYRRSLDRRWEAVASVVAASHGELRLRFGIADSVWRGRSWRDRAASPLIPDHGKLMHLFLIRAVDAGAFAHLHPVSVDSATFETPLPALPGGRYRVFADVTHESGYARTLVAEVELPGGGETAPTDPDDAWFVGEPSAGAAGLARGARLVWENRPAALAAGADAGLEFTVRESDGSIGAVEHYLGMSGHAVIMREDGKVYVHLHQMGTVSQAAQVALRERRPADTARGALGRRLTESGALAAHSGPQQILEGRAAFPYAFPEPGRYRVWVQVKRQGVVETASFRVQVN
jgi:uncharacterized protein YjeT (DUF2065 family)